MSFFTNSENIVNASGQYWSIVKHETNIHFSCSRESGITGHYFDDNYVPYMSSLLTEQSYPKALVSGLGLGVIPQWLCDNKNAIVDVVEIDSELITAVTQMNYLHSNINIINHDINTYQTSIKYDLIYFDHWFFPDDSNFTSERDSLINAFSVNKSDNGVIVFPVHKEIF